MRWFVTASLLCSMTVLSGCDVFDSIQRPKPEIHMYGDAININSFQKIANARIVVQIDNKTQRFTGSYDVMVPISHSLAITATAPGYQQYQMRTVLNPQGSGQLRSPLMMRPISQQ